MTLFPAPHLPQAAAALLLVLVALPCWPMYKVVMPDGSVTYTDRPPLGSNARVTPMALGSKPGAPTSGLPLELQQVVARYPVTLYTTADCVPCEGARRLLQQRGVPYSERRVVTEEDGQALDRLVGGRKVPTLSIGPQPLRGLSETDWHSFLDVAGYPRSSRLPAGWQPPVPTPLTEPAAAAPAPALRLAPAPVPAPRGAAEDAAPSPAGFRF